MKLKNFYFPKKLSSFGNSVKWERSTVLREIPDTCNFRLTELKLYMADKFRFTNNEQPFTETKEKIVNP